MTLDKDTSAESGWVYDTVPNPDDYVWRYGTERSCDLKGKYITFEADFSSEASNYEKTICIIGVMGNFCDEEGISCTDEQETNFIEEV